MGRAGRRLTVVVIGLLTLSVAGPAAAAEPKDPQPDADMLLNLDILQETNLAKDRELYRRLKVIERLRIIERIHILDSETIAPVRKEVK